MPVGFNTLLLAALAGTFVGASASRPGDNKPALFGVDKLPPPVMNGVNSNGVCVPAGE
jgi:hypothetical protein